MTLLLSVKWKNGEIYLYDMSYLSSYEGGPMIQPLKKISYFKKVFLEYGCPTWPNGFDIDSAYIAMKGKLIKKPPEL